MELEWPIPSHVSKTDGPRFERKTSKSCYPIFVPTTQEVPCADEGEEFLEAEPTITHLSTHSTKETCTGQAGHGGSASKLHPLPVHKHTQQAESGELLSRRPAWDTTNKQ